MTHNRLLQQFKQAVAKSIGDARRIPERSQNVYEIARSIWKMHYKDALHESVLEEFSNADIKQGE